MFGRFQPPARDSEVQRNLQAAIVRDFVQAIFAREANARVVVLGDLNDFEFSAALDIVKSAGLTDLVETLPAQERYTYVFEGNLQVLDHILASGSLVADAEYDVVHVNSEFFDQASDHDPEVARFNLPATIVEVTGQVGTYSSGLIYVRRTQTFNGTIRITNTGNTTLAGPLQVVLNGLPASVVLANANGRYLGAPYLTSNVASLSPGRSTTVNVSFRNPSRTRVSYSLRVYSGSL